MKTNIIIASVIGVVVIAGLVLGLTIHFNPDVAEALGQPPLNELGMTRPGRAGPVVLQPSTDHILLLDSSVDPDPFHEAVAWWQAQDQPFTDIGVVPVPEDVFQRFADKTPNKRIGYYLVSVEELASDRCGGVTTLQYDLDTGEVWSGIIKLNRAHTYDPTTYRAAAIHEIGHILTLEDDPNPGIDLNSIMRLQLNPRGILTGPDQQYLKNGGWRGSNPS